MKTVLFLGIAIAVVATVACVAQTTSTQSSDRTDKASGQSTQFAVDDTHAARTYANFCRVTGSPEELIVDFGLNAEPVGAPKDPIVIDQRIIMSFYTAKRLMTAIQLSIERHEQVFGPLETDIEKRIKGNR